MKYRLLDLLACPGCGAHPLALTVLETDPGPQPAVTGTRCADYCGREGAAIRPGDPPRACAACYTDEIREGILGCPGCGADFPIVGGIPRFNPDAASDHPAFFQKYREAFHRRTSADPADADAFEALHSETKQSFGFQWLRYQVTDHAENQDHFYRRTATQPGTLGGKLWFEAGCGMGRYLKVVSGEPGAEAVGLDLSLAVHRAYAENKLNPLIHVVQGNLLQLPLRPARFDHVYSIGVLHHTPSTKRAFERIVKLAKPGGRLSIWVYHVWRPPGLRGLKALHAGLKGWISDTLRILTTRLPHRLLHYFCYLAVPTGWMQIRVLKLPAPLQALLSPILLIPFSSHPDWRVRVCDTFDWLSPRYQWKHTVAEVRGWFEDQGLEEIDTEGFPVTVRGRRAASGARAAP